MAQRLMDMFFTKASVTAMADAIKKSYGKFDRKKFLRLVFDSAFKGLELKQMMRHTTLCLRKSLPENYGQAIRRKRSFADMSTRKHYPGEHHIAIVVNGKESCTAAFNLVR